MATVEKTIKTGGDYTTIAGWESDLDESSIYSSGDTAVGLVSGDHEISTKITFNSGGTVGLDVARLTVPEADRHDGTAGSGVTLTVSTTNNYCFESTSASVRNAVEWLEFDYEDTNHGGDEWIKVVSSSTVIGCAPMFAHNLIHNVDAGSNIGRILQMGGWWSAVHNNILYKVRCSSPHWCNGIQCGERVMLSANNTVYDVVTTGNGAYGMTLNTSGSYIRVYNNISVGTSGTSSADYKDTWTGGTIGTNNLSSDTSASGTDAVHSEAAADLFVSTTSGSEDLHLKSGAAAIGAAADLGGSVTVYGNAIGSSTTGTAINFDIDNYNREDAAVTAWDIGADQYVAASTGGGTAPIVLATTMAGL